MVIQKRLESETYLTFQLEDEVFAADVRNVHEVLEFTSITKIPGTPDFMRGIINLRGQVVPVVDLRLKFSMTETEHTVNTCIIVMDVGVGRNKAIIGALADSVKDVFEFEPDQIEPAPRIGSMSQIEYIQGIGKRDNQFIIILNFNRVFSTDEVVMLNTAGEMTTETEEEGLENPDNGSVEESQESP